LSTVRRLRDDEHISVWATMDAGPHVKALCAAADAERVSQALLKTEGVLRTIVASPGPGVEIL
jgi:diphosphomevalonate decarboxylase